MSLPPWDQMTFSFGWEPWEHTMRQCSNLKVEFSTDLAPGYVANPPPAPPYTVVIYAGGYRPLTMAVGNSGPNGTFDWVVNLPLGPQYLLSMTDSAGYNGGSSLLWSMTAGKGGCPLDPSPITPSTLSFTRTGSAQCGQISYTMNNGTSPYQIEIIPEIHIRRTLYFATNQFSFTMDLPTSLNVYVAITDADGNSAVDELMTVGTSNDNSCLKAAQTVSIGRVTTMYTGSGVSMPTPRPTSTAEDAVPTTGKPSSDNKSMGGKTVPIIAGVVGGIVAIALTVFILICISHRRRRRAASQVQPPTSVMQQQVNLPQNPHTYYSTPIPRYPSMAIPQIQTPSPHAHVPEVYQGYHAGSTPPNDAYTQHFPHLTTHVPRPQSYQNSQSLLIDANPTPDQSSYMSRFSQGTVPGSENAGSQRTSDVAATGTYSSDRKQRIASPGLPPGALPPSRSSDHQWVPQTPGTPGNGDINPFGSPLPRPGTALPPYELPQEEPKAQQPGTG